MSFTSVVYKRTTTGSANGIDFISSLGIISSRLTPPAPPLPPPVSVQSERCDICEWKAFVLLTGYYSGVSQSARLRPDVSFDSSEGVRVLSPLIRVIVLLANVQQTGPLPPLATVAVINMLMRFFLSFSFTLSLSPLLFLCYYLLFKCPLPAKVRLGWCFLQKSGSTWFHPIVHP